MLMDTKPVELYSWREGRITSSQFWGVSEEGTRLHQNRGLNVGACKHGVGYILGFQKSTGSR